MRHFKVDTVLKIDAIWSYVAITIQYFAEDDLWHILVASWIHRKQIIFSKFFKVAIGKKNEMTMTKD